MEFDKIKIQIITDLEKIYSEFEILIDIYKCFTYRILYIGDKEIKFPIVYYTEKWFENDNVYTPVFMNNICKYCFLEKDLKEAELKFNYILDSLLRIKKMVIEEEDKELVYLSNILPLEIWKTDFMCRFYVMANIKDDYLIITNNMIFNSLNEKIDNCISEIINEKNRFYKKNIMDDTNLIHNKNSNEPQTKIEPIVWTGDNVLLGYLIQWLKDEGFISKKSARDTLIKNHFVDEKSKPIENIKQALANMKAQNDGGLPKNYEKIEPLLKTLKDLL